MTGTGQTIAGVGLNLTAMKDGDIGSLDALLGRYVEYGCSHVELTARRLDVVVDGRLNIRRMEQVAEIVSRHKVTPTLHAPHGINLMDTPRHDQHVAATEASIAFCQRLGIPSMVMHHGRVPHSEWVDGKAAFLAQEREALRRLGDIAGAAGVNIAVENIIARPGKTGFPYGADVRALTEQLAAVNHPAVGGCLDFGHAWLSATTWDFDFVDALETFSEFVWHLHLHDNCGRPDDTRFMDGGDRVALGFGDMHAPMFWGTIPWAELLPRMRFRPNTYGMIELAGRYNHEARTVVDTAWAFAAFLNGTADATTLESPYIPDTRIGQAAE
jgi:sugar phosphate isomerase/epimerase